MEFFRTNAEAPDNWIARLRCVRWYWVLALLSLVPLCSCSRWRLKVGIAVIGGWIALIWVAIAIVRDIFTM